jgi:hypothetical protein
MGYYKTIAGKKMDANIISRAEEAIKGARDGRISKNDAQAIIKATKDAGRITDVEKTSLQYVAKKFQWTDAASGYLKEQIGKLKPAYYKTVEGQKMDGAILTAAAEAVKGSGDGRISKADAAKIFRASKDGGVITTTEIKTLAWVYHQYKWTEAASSWFYEQLQKNAKLARE